MNSSSVQQILFQFQIQSFHEFAIYYQTCTLQAPSFGSMFCELPKKKRYARKIQVIPQKKIYQSNFSKSIKSQRCQPKKISTLEDFLVDLQTQETESFIDKFIINPNDTTLELQQQVPSLIQPPSYDHKFQMILQEFQSNQNENLMTITPFQTFGEDQQKQGMKNLCITNPLDFSLSTSRTKFREHYQQDENQDSNENIFGYKTNDYNSHEFRQTAQNYIFLDLMQEKNLDSFGINKIQKQKNKRQKQFHPLQPLQDISNIEMYGKTIVNLEMNLTNFMDDMEQSQASYQYEKQSREYNIFNEEDKENYRNTIKYGF